jgi:hypothetical protein
MTSQKEFKAAAERVFVCFRNGRCDGKLYLFKCSWQ